jgi:uncharacterized protein (TIGR02001 family)
MRFTTLLLGTAALLSASPVLAQTAPAPDTTPAQDNSPPTQSASQTAASESGDTAPPKPFTLTAAITGTSDYRFRGVTQTAKGAAVQGTVNLNTAIGFYVGTWASTIDGKGSTPALTGYGTEEVDLYGGYTKTYHGVGIDAGVLYYYYANHVKGLNTDFFEPYASLSYTIGPVAAKVGANYAWAGQDGLRGLDTRYSAARAKDNIYAYGEASLGVPKTPITLKGHVGYSKGALGALNQNARDDSYLDWSGTAEAVGGPFKLGVSYVDTDISESRGIYTVGNQQPRSGRFADVYGRGKTVLGYVGVSF